MGHTTDRAAFFREQAARIDAFAAETNLPGIAAGLIENGELVWTHGTGATRLDAGTAPDADSIFRIASMTKSFTAAAILLLRDRGALALDDAIVNYLPWTASIGAPSHSAPLTIRHLLTMNAGFPTDDPWGDRHEPTPLAAFDALVEGGLSFARAPGTGFEYSNLGYALLGRVVNRASGRDYLEFVTSELLGPLGMTATCYATDGVDEARRAHGYARRAGDLVPEPPVPPGAFSPMGGLHSSVRDLARWVRGFLDGSSPHPLAAASRSEMQFGKTFARTALLETNDGPKTATTLYGYGLFSLIDSRLGRFVYHSGGYPGFGSHMRWHPASGWGIVALANATYAPASTLASAILDDAVAAFAPPPDVAASLWPETLAATALAERLVRGWDDTLADASFAHNMDLDVPRVHRRLELARIGAELGAFERRPGSLRSDSPAHAVWEVCGANGSAAFELFMSPDRPPKIQFLTVATVPRAEP